MTDIEARLRKAISDCTRIMHVVRDEQGRFHEVRTVDDVALAAVVRGMVDEQAAHHADCCVDRQTLAEQEREIEDLRRRAEDKIDERDVEIGRKLQEIERLRGWVGDLQSGLFINCVYCGFRYGPGESTPATLPEAGETLAATALREHVEQCQDHPMSRLKKEIERLREAIDHARHESASDPESRWARNATIILNAALRATPEAKGS